MKAVVSFVERSVKDRKFYHTGLRKKTYTLNDIDHLPIITWVHFYFSNIIDGSAGSVAGSSGSDCDGRGIAAIAAVSCS